MITNQQAPERPPKVSPPSPKRRFIPMYLYPQFIRFVLVGCANTAIDVITLNALLWVLPASNATLIVLANSIAYTTGAINSFLLNRYWTFQRAGRPAIYEARRFAVVTLGGIACNDALLALLTGIAHPGALNLTLWINIVKVISIGGTVLISYLLMRLWVFAHRASGKLAHPHAPAPPAHDISLALSSIPEQTPVISTPLCSTHSLSVVLPAYNEEQVIAATICNVLTALCDLVADFEVLVVNDGSIDGTAAIVADISQRQPQVRLITHERNQGYGAALVDGFAAASRELTFFMDADGQFDIRELAFLLGSIDKYDAVIGYRLNRQDTWMRKLNAWGWKMVIRLALGVRVRDLDCAFKLLHTGILQRISLETRGAMINAELLYKMKQHGYAYKEVGVHHFQRQGGKATGANLRVILRAFRECFLYARKWRHEFSYEADR